MFMATLDDHPIALDARSGRLASTSRRRRAPEAGYALTVAPSSRTRSSLRLARIRRAWIPRRFDATTGRRYGDSTRFPDLANPARNPLATPEACGASVWVTGSYDPDLNLTYWGLGNPGPDWNGASREGDNLYSDGVVALDADTGTLKWHFQFTPHDEMDYDSTQVPVLADLEWQGRMRKVMLWANRNGFLYVLDTNGRFPLGKPH
jgi:alcohol dehydrogenase (cytochrome c)